MPTRYVDKYMIVKTDKGYIRVDKDGNKLPINKTSLFSEYTLALELILLEAVKGALKVFFPLNVWSSVKCAVSESK